MLRWVLIFGVLGGLTYAGVTWTSAQWQTEAQKPWDPNSIEKRFSVEVRTRNGFVHYSGTEAEMTAMMDPNWAPPHFEIPAGSRSFFRKINENSSQTRTIPPGQPIPTEPGWVEVETKRPPPREKDSKENIDRRINAIAKLLNKPLPPGVEKFEEAPKPAKDLWADTVKPGWKAPGGEARNAAQAGGDAKNAAQYGAETNKAQQAEAEARNEQIARIIRGLPGHVGTKEHGLDGLGELREPDLGPSITLQIPPKPSDPLEAFYYKHTVGELLRLRNGPAKERDQKALDLFARWSRARAGLVEVSPSELCLMWRSVPWRQPLADHIYERNERNVLPESQRFFISGLRFTATTESLEKARYSPYMQMMGNIAAAHEILSFFSTEDVGKKEAKKYADKASALLPAVLDDPDLSAEALLTEMDVLCDVRHILTNDAEPAMSEILEAIRKKRPEILPLVRGSVMIKLAWQARGGGYANTITEEGGRLFDLRLKKARASLTEAWEKTPTAGVAMEMMSVCLGQSDVRGHAVWYNRAINLRPDSSLARNQRLQAVCGKWFGSDAEMFEFAREGVERYRKDPTLSYSTAVLICSAHREAGVAAGDVEAYLARKEVYAEIKDVLELIVKHGPQRLEVWSRLAYHADLAGDYGTVNVAFAAAAKDGLHSTIGFPSERHWQRAKHRAWDRAGKR